MRWILDGLQFALTFIEIIMCFRYIELFVPGGEFQGRVSKKWYVGIWSVALAALLGWNRQHTYFSWGVFLTISVLEALSEMKYKKGKKLILCDLAMIYNVGVALMDFMLIYIYWHFVNTPHFYEMFTLNNNLQRIGIMIFTRVLFYILLVMLEHNSNIKNFDFSTIKGYLLGISAVGFIGVFCFLNAFVEEIETITLSVGFCAFLLIFTFLALLGGYLTHLTTKNRIEIIRIHAELLECNYKEIDKLYQSRAKTFHDFNNHIIYLQRYVEESRREEALKYIKEIRQPFEQISKHVCSGNESIDLILNYKKNYAEGLDIAVEVSVADMAHLEIKDYDICVIMGNLLDNAIEAAVKVTDGKRWIKVVLRNKGNQTAITILNSMKLMPVGDLNRVKTTKKGEGWHGLGLENVKAIVKKYDGQMKSTFNEKEYKVSITLFGK